MDPLILTIHLNLPPLPCLYPSYFLFSLVQIQSLLLSVDLPLSLLICLISFISSSSPSPFAFFTTLRGLDKALGCFEKDIVNKFPFSLSFFLRINTNLPKAVCVCVAGDRVGVGGGGGRKHPRPHHLCTNTNIRRSLSTTNPSPLPHIPSSFPPHLPTSHLLLGFLII